MAPQPTAEAAEAAAAARSAAAAAAAAMACELNSGLFPRDDMIVFFWFNYFALTVPLYYAVYV